MSATRPMPRRGGLVKAVRYDDPAEVPAVEIDEYGYPVKPKRVVADPSVEERKVLWLLFWNYSCGNKTVACQEAGVTRREADEWIKKDKRMKVSMEAAQEEIADRLLLRVAQRTGLLPMPEGVKVHDTSLYGLARKYKPDMFGDMGEPDESDRPRPDSNIPRPKPAQKPGESPI